MNTSKQQVGEAVYWDNKGKWTVFLGLAVFIAGVVLEARCGFVNIVGDVMAGLNMALPQFLVCIIGVGGILLVIRTIIFRLIAARRWRAFCQPPRYVGFYHRKINDF